MAIKELKNNKTAGSDNVAAELLKEDITTTTDMLYPSPPLFEKNAADRWSVTESWTGWVPQGTIL